MNKNSPNLISTPVARNTIIDSKVSKEYIAFHDLVTIKELNKDRIEIIHSKLFKEETSQKEKKELLFQLAHSSNPEAYKVLQDFYFQSKGFLQMWSSMALEECQMFVQMEMSDKLGVKSSMQSDTMISSLGGGDGQRLRFWVVLTSKEGKKFNKKAQLKLKQIFDKHFSKNNSLIEKIDWSDEYCVLSSLQPMDVAIDDILTPILEDTKATLSFHYFTINTNYPTSEEIKDYIAFLKDEDLK